MRNESLARCCWLSFFGDARHRSNRHLENRWRTSRRSNGRSFWRGRKFSKESSNRKMASAHCSMGIRARSVTKRRSSEAWATRWKFMPRGSSHRIPVIRCSRKEDRSSSRMRLHCCARWGSRKNKSRRVPPPRHAALRRRSSASGW